MMAKTKRPKISFVRRMLTARGRNLEITKSGWLFILLTLAVGFAAINSGSNLLHVVFGCQMGMIVASGVLSERMVRRAVVRRTVESNLHAGSAAALRVDLRNASSDGGLLAVSVEDDDRETDLGNMQPVFSLALGPTKGVRLGSTVVMPRRGVHPLPPAVVATRFPFGLFIKRRELPQTASVLVYPAVHPRPTEAHREVHVSEGESATGAKARAGEFFGLREYRDGDDVHRVHWPATARLGRTVLREYESHGLTEHWIALAPGVMGAEEFEARVETAASEAVASLRRAERAVGLRYGEDVVVPPGFGPDQETRILGFLATVGEAGAGGGVP
jgi:uncharacterized protein (DUF58 family)